MQSLGKAKILTIAIVSMNCSNPDYKNKFLYQSETIKIILWTIYVKKILLMNDNKNRNP